MSLELGTTDKVGKYLEMEKRPVGFGFGLFMAFTNMAITNNNKNVEYC